MCRCHWGQDGEVWGPSPVMVSPIILSHPLSGALSLQHRPHPLHPPSAAPTSHFILAVFQTLSCFDSPALHTKLWWLFVALTKSSTEVPWGQGLLVVTTASYGRATVNVLEL